MPEKVLYFHSRCCQAHWELVWREGKYSLECEICGNPAGNFKIRGPTIRVVNAKSARKKEGDEKD